MAEQEKTEFRDSIVEAIDKKLDQRFIENNHVVLEAVKGVIDKRMQEAAVRQEQFESNIVGMLQDIKSSISETQKITERVDAHESVIKNNILPRIEILEKAA